MIFMKALFASGIVLFVEKLLLQFVAINFHEKALAERIAENQLGLKALDHLSNAQITQIKKSSARKGVKSPTPVYSNPGRVEKEASVTTETLPVDAKKGRSSSPFPSSPQKSRKKKNVTSVIVNQVGLLLPDSDRTWANQFQVGGAIGQVALKHSKFHKQGDSTSVYSARKLAKKLFSVLSASDPPRSHLLEEDFYPYFRSTAEAVSL
jgi:uncharacterized protein YunC (DUF1805 family)